jgi:hypothetical protein
MDQVESAYQDLCRIGDRNYATELDEAATRRAA